MTAVESLFKETRCASCLKVMPVERVHLFRSAETPRMFESLAFCTKDCEIDYGMKEIAGLAKAFLVSMNELDEDSMRVIERKFKIERQRIERESRRSRKIKCARCGHIWLTISKNKMVSCPSCLGKTPNTFAEQ